MKKENDFQVYIQSKNKQRQSYFIHFSFLIPITTNTIQTDEFFLQKETNINCIRVIRSIF